MPGSLVSSLVPTTGHHHPTLSPIVGYGVEGGAVANRLRRRTSDQTVVGSNPAVAAALSPWTLHQHGTRGRQQGDFRPFQQASLAGRISFTNRAPLLWNILPREVQTSSSILVLKKKVLSLLDSPVSGKNLLQICLEPLPSNYFSSFLSLLFLPFRVGPLLSRQFCLLRFLP